MYRIYYPTKYFQLILILSDININVHMVSVSQKFAIFQWSIKLAQQILIFKKWGWKAGFCILIDLFDLSMNICSIFIVGPKLAVIAPSSLTFVTFSTSYVKVVLSCLPKVVIKCFKHTRSRTSLYIYIQKELTNRNW